MQKICLVRSLYYSFKYFSKSSNERKSWVLITNNKALPRSPMIHPTSLCEITDRNYTAPYCLPLLVYCVGALRLTSSAIRQLSFCWNDAFRKNFNFKRFESVRTLQIEFGSIDFQHLYHKIYMWWTALHQISIPQFNNLSLTFYCLSGGLDPPLSLADKN